MRRTNSFILALALAASLALPVAVLAASPMMGTAIAATPSEKAQTVQDEAAGRALWDKLQAKQTDCATLTEDDFDALGDYFMGLMAGDAHAQMNANMVRMMGVDGEKQMHVALGERLSGCQADASTTGSTASGRGVPVWGMMRNAWSARDTEAAPRANDAWPMWAFMTVTMLLVWTVLVLVILALAKWILKQK